ncbi:MAG: hypothetical protein AAF773_02770 [Cyanobacteria bacterium P01_D01_bin.115]
MSAALQSQEIELQPPASSMRSQSRRRLTALPSPQPAAPAVFPSAQQRDRPNWLKLLVAGQRVSVVATTLGLAGALAAYALTVNTHRRLTAATVHLEHLQDQQQQLTTANAVFKNHLAQAARTEMRNGNLHPRDVIFLEAAPLPASPSAPASEPADALGAGQRFFPKGY